jgi:hypothetical protein
MCKWKKYKNRNITDEVQPITFMLEAARLNPMGLASIGMVCV